jgi:hypothetical protein
LTRLSQFVKNCTRSIKNAVEDKNRITDAGMKALNHFQSENNKYDNPTEEVMENEVCRNRI